MSDNDKFELEPRLGAVSYKPDMRDYRVPMISPEVIEILKETPEMKELLDYLSVIKVDDQGNIGSCVGWCNSKVREIVDNINRANDRYVDLSAGYVYHYSRKYAGIPLPAEGSTNFGAMKALLKEGAPWESFVRTDTVRPFEIEIEEKDEENAKQYRIKAYYRVATNPADMKAALMGLTHDPGYKMPDGSKGKCPLVTAYPVYNTFREGYDHGYVPLPEKGDNLLGGHSSAIIGWFTDEKGEEWWINSNSWGRIGGSMENSEGDEVEGLFFLPIEYPFYDCWVIEVEGETPEPDPDPEPEPEPEPEGDVIKVEIDRGPLGSFIAGTFSALAKGLKWGARFFYGNRIRDSED